MACAIGFKTTSLLHLPKLYSPMSVCCGESNCARRTIYDSSCPKTSPVPYVWDLKPCVASITPIRPLQLSRKGPSRLGLGLVEELGESCALCARAPHSWNYVFQSSSVARGAPTEPVDSVERLSTHYLRYLVCSIGALLNMATWLSMPAIAWRLESLKPHSIGGLRRCQASAPDP